MVQRLTQKIPEGFENMIYRKLNLISLKDRGYLIKMFKVQKGLEKIDWAKKSFLIKN